MLKNNKIKSNIEKGDDLVIILAGQIGVGKSTATKILQEHFGTEAFYEPVDSNPYLELFYGEPEKYALRTQLYFLGQRFAMIKQALKNRRNILDRSIYEDRLFAGIQVEKGNMSEEDMKLYDTLADEMMEEIEGMPKKAPDLLVYLESPFETIIDRISNRGRTYEKPDKELIEYYQTLQDKYPVWFEEYNASPKIKIENYGEYDLSTDKGKQHLIDEVEKALKENKI